MSPGNSGQTADLWAVGGKQLSPSDNHKKLNWFEFCPGCRWKLTGKFSTCPRCGEDLRTRICHYCRGLIPVGAEKCPRCTAVLTDPADLK